MRRIIRQIIERVFKVSIQRVNNADNNTNPLAYPAHIQQYINAGNVVIGEGCKVEGNFVASFYALENNFLNLQIGADCHILGTIELQSPTAKVVIGDRVFIGPGSKLFCRDSIVLEDDVMISWGITLIDTNAHALDWERRKNDIVQFKNDPLSKNWEFVESKSIHVQSKCWIGFNSIITKGVTLAEGTVVGCGSVVTKSSMPFSVLGGNPAVVVKMLQ